MHKCKYSLRQLYNGVLFFLTFVIIYMCALATYMTILKLCAITFNTGFLQRLWCKSEIKIFLNGKEETNLK